MRVIVTDTASQEIDSIFDYIAADSWRRATDVVERIDSAVRELSTTALTYPLFPERATAGVRRRIVRPYLIFYRAVGDVVEVLHVIHGARDLRGVFGDDD